jgi:hypothetical protein
LEQWNSEAKNTYPLYSTLLIILHSRVETHPKGGDFEDGTTGGGNVPPPV